MPIPTADEIAELPLGAQIAFAVRCSRRSVPVLRDKFPGKPELAFEIELLTEEVRFCGLAWWQKVSDQKHERVKSILALAAKSFSLRASSALSKAEMHEAELGHAAIKALEHLYDAANRVSDYVSKWPQGDRTGRFAAPIRQRVAESVARASQAFNQSCQRDSVALAIEKDFDRLVRRARSTNWKDRTNVTFEFGPIWPDGAPEGWPGEEG